MLLSSKLQNSRIFLFLSISRNIFIVKSLWSIRNVSTSKSMLKVNNKSTRLMMRPKLIRKAVIIKIFSLIRRLCYWLRLSLPRHTSASRLTCNSLVLGKEMLYLNFWICFVLPKLEVHVWINLLCYFFINFSLSNVEILCLKIFKKPWIVLVAS